MEIKIFGKSECTKCHAVMTKVQHFLSRWGVRERVAINFVDMNTIDGRAEGAFNDVLQIPTTILWNDAGQQVGRWNSALVRSDDLKNCLTAH